MDSNARSTSWYDFMTNERGRALEEYFASRSLLIVNEYNATPTFETIRGSSCIDLTVLTSNLVSHVSEWAQPEEESSSDHCYITYRIGVGGHRDVTHHVSAYKFNTKKANWDLFRSLTHTNFLKLLGMETREVELTGLDGALQSFIHHSRDLERSVELFFEQIILACSKSIPRVLKKKRHLGKTVSWWSDDLDIRRKRVNASRRLYQRTYHDPTLREVRKKLYFDLKRQYQQAIKEAKLESWKTFCSATSANNPWNFTYKVAAGKLRPSTCITTVRKADGQFTADLEETVDVIMNKFLPEDDPAHESPIHGDMRLEVEKEIDTADDIEFSRLEVERAIKSMRPNKAPGWDGLTSDILIEVFNLYPAALTLIYAECLSRGIFPSCWKKSQLVILAKPGKCDLEDPSKFRPISLLPVAGKVLEKLMIDRIMHHMNFHRLLSDNQFGFRPQMSTVSALKEATEFIQTYFEMKWDVLLISLDVQGAFDAAWWPSILKRLREFNCPRNLYYLSKSYFSDRSASLSLNSLWKEAKVTKGCPQGSRCGPGFWIVMYDGMIRLPFPGRCVGIAFADDFLILVAGQSSLELSVDGDRILRLIERWSSDNKINFNKTKSKVLHLSRRGKPDDEEVSVHLDGERLEVVESLKYLGVVFDRKLCWDQHVDYICEKGLRFVNILSRAAKVHWGLGSEALDVIYKGAFVPLMLYAAPIWHSSLKLKKNRVKIERVQRLLLIRLIKGYRTISFNAACVIAGKLPICLRIEEQVGLDTLLAGGTAYGREGSMLDKPVGFKDWPHPAELPQINIDQFQICDTSIFTDGSKDGDCVGCAFVVFRQNEIVAEGRFRLDSWCSNNQAEQLAIVKALEWLRLNLVQEERVRIATDSRITLDSLLNADNHLPLIEAMRKILGELQQRCTVSFSWVKAHVGIDGNERADELAKSASKDAAIPISYEKYPKTAVKFWLHERSVEAWEQLWGESLTGTATREFFPSVLIRLHMHHLVLDYRMTQILSQI